VPLLNPALFAAGLASVIVPILVHFLLRRRRRPVAFGAMRFVLEAYRNQRRKTKFEQLVLLLVRCLVLVVAAFAVGRPLARSGLFGTAPGAGGNTLILIVDNSLTTTATAGAVGGDPDIAALKDSAQRLLGQLSTSRGDRAALLTAAAPIDAPVPTPASDLPGVMDAIRRITPADSSADFAAALARAKEIISTMPEAAQSRCTIALCTAWRLGSADLSKPGVPLSLPAGIRVVMLPPVEAAAPNVSITSVEPLRATLVMPDDPRAADRTTILVNVVAERTDTAASLTLPVRIAPVTAGSVSSSGTVQATGSLVFAPGSARASVMISAPVPAEAVRAGSNLALVASIDPNDSIAGDNFSVAIVASRVQLRAGIFAQGRLADAEGAIDRFSPAEWISLALSPENSALDRKLTEIEAVTLDPVSAPAPEVAGLDAAFVVAPHLLSERTIKELAGMLRAGKLVVVFPPSQPVSPAWADTLAQGLNIGLGVRREPLTLDRPQPLSIGQPRPLLQPIIGELPGLLAPVTLTRTWPLESVPQDWISLLRSGDQPVVVSGRPPDSKGLVIWWTVAPDLMWTNLPAMPLFVPFVQEILRQGVGSSAGSTESVAGLIPAWPTSASQLRPVDIPGRVARPQSATEPARTAGVWRAIDSSSKTLGLFAVLPNTAASATEPADRARVSAWMSGVVGSGRLAWIDDARSSSAGEDGTSTQRTPWDLWLLAGLAAFLVIESIVARRVSPWAASAQAPGLSQSSRTEAAA